MINSRDGRKVVCFKIFVVCLISLLYFYTPTIAVVQYRFEKLWPTLQQPWFFAYPIDIAIDATWNAYVVDKTHNRIQKFTTDGKFITTWGTEGSDNGQFNSPSGIAVDTEGFIYVADTGNNRIQKFSSSGVFISAWGTNGQFATPFGVAADDQGYIYIADTGNNRIQKFTTDGIFIKKWGRNQGDGSSGRGDGEFALPSGIVVDAQRFIYVVDTFNHRIQKFASDGTFITKWGRNGGDGSSGKNAGEFNSPAGIEVDSSGFIYVSDTQNQRIQKFRPDGTYDSQWGTFGAAERYFKSPNGIASDVNGYLYVADTGNQRIQKFTTSGTFVAKWGSADIEKGFFKHTNGIAVDENGSIYVSDDDNHRIQKFAADGTFIAKWGKNFGDGSSGSGSGEFYHPAGVAVGTYPQHYIYVVDSYNNRIQRFTSDGVPVPWGEVDISTTDFSHPYGITTDAAGYIYITDLNNDRVLKFNSDGALLKTWGTTGVGNGEFSKPTGIVITTKGYLYVADNWNNRIQKFTTDGDFIAKWGKNGGDGSSGSGDGELAFPIGIAADADGYIFVADTGNNRIQKFTSDGSFVTKWGTFGIIPGQFSMPDSVAIGSGGYVYVADTINNRIQVFKKEELSENAKAIIVAGGGDYQGNNLWNATQLCANFAHRTLLYKGFTKETIYYLSSDLDLDLDENGKADDVDADATNASLESAISTWAAGAQDVVLYLVDHGGSGTFRMSQNETLSITDFAAWLDALQGRISGKIIFVYDACESGSFIPALAKSNRIIITSTSVGENAYFITQGTISFSEFFWTHIFNGKDVLEAFTMARDNVHATAPLQNPLLAGSASGVYIGTTPPGTGSAPSIGSISPPQTISNTNTASLYADSVTDADGIARVWAVVTPPGYSMAATDNSVLELPQFELFPVGGNRYEAVYNGFTSDGTYQIAIYARDAIGNTSSPSLTAVTVNQPYSRKAIIVAGGSLELWQPIWNNAQLAYEALTYQGYRDEDIYFMSPVTYSTGVDVLPTKDNINFALSSWAKDNTRDVVLYVVGYGGDGNFTIRTTSDGPETLTPSELDAWLDILQASIPGAAAVIYDGAQSGSFISALTPPAGKQRIIVCSSGTSQPAYFLSGGDVSFSRYFWKQVLNGKTIRESFYSAKNALAFSCPGQAPELDDNGNGVANEKDDGPAAQLYTIGAGIKLAGNDPQSGAVGPAQTLRDGETTATVSVEITATDTIKKAWAVITPPGYSPGESAVTGLPIIELQNTTGKLYEGTYAGFTCMGTYTVDFYATIASGTISMPTQSSVLQTSGLSTCPDIYEDDDTYKQARQIVLNSQAAQRHNFHDNGDEDWVMFFGLADGKPYTIEVLNPEGNCDPVIELYAENGKTQLFRVDDGAAGINETLNVPSVTMDGIYYVRILNKSEVYGEKTAYELKAYRPGAFMLGVVAGTIENAANRAPMSGVRLHTNGGQTAVSSQGEYEMPHPEGRFSLTVEAKGFKTVSENVEVPEGEIVIKNFTMVPVSTTTSSIKPSSTTTRPSTTTTQPGTTTIRPSTTTIQTGTTTAQPFTTTTQPGTTTTQSSTTTTSIRKLCPALFVFGGQETKEIKVLREYRDRVLAQSAAGTALINVYYTHADEITAILSSHPQLAERARDYIERAIPSIENALVHKKLILSHKLRIQIISLSQDIQDQSPPHLKKVIGSMIKEVINSQQALNPSSEKLIVSFSQ